MNRARAGRPGAASLALAAILAITAAWWALALWPAGAAPQPEWLVRTRSACFGSSHGGLPDAGGWILLIGQPLGMLGVLVAAWGEQLRAELRALLAHRRWRLAGAAGAVVAAGMGAFLVVGWGAVLDPAAGAPVPGAITPMDLDISAITLTDQRGRRTSFADLRGHPVLLTFAYSHCASVCPLLVHDVLAARAAATRPDVAVVVVTLDPWRDTPERLPTIAAQWGLAPGDRVLSGSVADVEAALDRLGIGRRRDERTGDVDHAAAVMLVDARAHVVRRRDGGTAPLAGMLTGSR